MLAIAWWRRRPPTAGVPVVDAGPGRTVVLVDGSTAPADLAGSLGVAADAVAVALPGDRCVWLPHLATTAAGQDVARIVVWAGGRDVRAGRPIADVVHHVADTVDTLADEAPTCVVMIVAAPTGRDRWAGAVRTLNRGLARVAADRGVTWLDPFAGHVDARGRTPAAATSRRGDVHPGVDVSRLPIR